MNEHLLPSWEELKRAGLVYVSSVRNEDVVSRQTILQLMRILKEEYNTNYILDTEKDELTAQEFNRKVLYEGVHLYSILTYEEMASNAQIRARILQRIKTKGQTNPNNQFIN